MSDTHLHRHKTSQWCRLTNSWQMSIKYLSVTGSIIAEGRGEDDGGGGTRQNILLKRTPESHDQSL